MVLFRCFVLAWFKSWEINSGPAPGVSPDPTKAMTFRYLDRALGQMVSSPEVFFCELFHSDSSRRSCDACGLFGFTNDRCL
jgi:hypothetical protein